MDGKQDLESGRIRIDESTSTPSGGSYQSGAVFRVGGRTEALWKLWSLVMLGMLAVLVCMISAFLGIYFGDVAKCKLVI
jgi:hypothetical protein